MSVKICYIRHKHTTMTSINSNSFYHNIEALITSILGIISGYIIHEITLEKSQLWLAIIGAIVLILIIERSILWLIVKVVQNSLALRKLIFAGHFIEGDWICAIYDPAVNEGEQNLVGYSKFTISFEEDKHIVKGSIINKECSQITGAFYSSHSEYSKANKELIYIFSGDNLNTRNHINPGSKKEIFGRATMKSSQETSKTKNPIQLFGHIEDTRNPNLLKTVCIRMNDDSIGEDLINLDKLKEHVENNSQSLGRKNHD